MTNQFPAPVDFNQRILIHLRAEFPGIDDEFLLSKSHELMDLAKLKRQVGPPAVSPESTLDYNAAQIGDLVPWGLLIQGMTFGDQKQIENGGESPIAAVDDRQETGTDLSKQQRGINLLQSYIDRIRAGDIDEVCIMGVRPDGNYELMYTPPFNAYGYYGFLTLALNAGLNQEGDGPAESTNAE